MVLRAVIQPSLPPPTPVPMVSPGQTLWGVLGRLANSPTDGSGAWSTAAASIQGRNRAKGVPRAWLTEVPRVKKLLPRGRIKSEPCTVLTPEPKARGRGVDSKSPLTTATPPRASSVS